MKERRTYSRELKSEAVRMVLEQGLVQEEVARRLSIPSGTLGNWIARFKGGEPQGCLGELTVSDLTAENARLKKELAEARMERDILKKAAAYFARESLPGTRS
jgi:transposase